MHEISTSSFASMLISIIVPLYNEEDCVQPLYEAITAAMSGESHRYELIFVDDGSVDETFVRAQSLAATDKRLRIIKFRRNFGQTPAMAAGIDHARGDLLVTMDGDLQNDPKDILRLIEKIAEGYDIVVGWRYARQDKWLSRTLPSMVANWMIGKVTGVPIKDNGCSLKAYKARIMKEIPLYSEMHRFIPAMASIAGTRVYEIKVTHHARQFGVSKYGLSRIYKVLFDLVGIKMIISVMDRPLRWFAATSAVFWLLALILLSIWFYQLMTSPSAPSVVFVGIGVLLVSLSMFLILLGVLAELICRTGDLKAERFAGLTMDLDFSEPQQFSANNHG